MNKPRIEVKSINVHASLTEETPAYSAKVYVDGKLFAEVKNAGHGGPDDYDFAKGQSWETLKVLNTRIAATYPAHECYGTRLEESLEMICHTVAFRHLEMKNFRSALSRKVMVRKDGKVYDIKGKKTPQLLEACRKHYGAENVLNDMSVEDAFAILEKGQN